MDNEMSKSPLYRKGFNHAKSLKDPDDNHIESFDYDAGYADGGGEVPLLDGKGNPNSSIYVTRHRAKMLVGK